VRVFLFVFVERVPFLADLCVAPLQMVSLMFEVWPPPKILFSALHPFFFPPPSGLSCVPSPKGLFFLPKNEFMWLIPPCEAMLPCRPTYFLDETTFLLGCSPSFRRENCFELVALFLPPVRADLPRCPAFYPPCPCGLPFLWREDTLDRGHSSPCREFSTGVDGVVS